MLKKLCVQQGAVIWEQELYINFKYKQPKPYFHTFDTDVSIIQIV